MTPGLQSPNRPTGEGIAQAEGDQGVLRAKMIQAVSLSVVLHESSLQKARSSACEFRYVLTPNLDEMSRQISMCSAAILTRDLG